MDPLKTTCTLKVKANSVKQEYEKQDELKRSALRAVAALASIPKAGKWILLSVIKDPINTYTLCPWLSSLSLFRQEHALGRVPYPHPKYPRSANSLRVRAKGLELGGLDWSGWRTVQRGLVQCQPDGPELSGRRKRRID